MLKGAATRFVFNAPQVSFRFTSHILYHATNSLRAQRPPGMVAIVGPASIFVCLIINTNICHIIHFYPMFLLLSYNYTAEVRARRKIELDPE